MGIKDFLADSAAVSAGLWLGRNFSRPALAKLSGFGGRILNINKRSAMVRNIKANQWVVSNGTLDKAGLDKASLMTTTRITNALFEYFYYYQRPQACKEVIVLSPRMKEALREIVDKKVPSILLGPHLGNFDLFGASLGWIGLKQFILSYPNPNSAYKAQNRLRQAMGMEIHPITLSAFREARSAMKEGYCVVTGIDRPLDNAQDAKYKPLFFGRPAAVPVFYIKLALDVGAVARVACGIPQPDHSYYVDCSDPIEFEKRNDVHEEYLLNAERVLNYTENFIRKDPTHWAMIHPVWPEVFAEIKYFL